MKYVHNLGCFAARLMWLYSVGNLTLRTSACVTLKNYIKINVCENVKKIKTINKCVCVCMLVCMDVNRVLNELCAQLGMLRCKINVVVFLGESNT